jgi:hypothetical protein
MSENQVMSCRSARLRDAATVRAESCSPRRMQSETDTSKVAKARALTEPRTTPHRTSGFGGTETEGPRQGGALL